MTQRRRRYGTFTPRRKAALRKAQLVSARKRRNRRRIIISGAVIGGVGVTAFAGAAVVGHRYASSLKGGPKAPVLSTSKELVHVPRTMTRTNLDMIKRKPRVNPIPKAPSNRRIFKVGKTGVIQQTTKSRMTYDLNRRRSYWQAKPVGGRRGKKR